MDYLKGNKIFWQNYGHKKQNQHLESRTKAFRAIFEQFSHEFLASWKKHVRLGNQVLCQKTISKKIPEVYREKYVKE